MIPHGCGKSAGPRMPDEGNGLAPALTIANRSAEARREIAVHERIVGTRISVDPLSTSGILGGIKMVCR